MNQCCTRMHFVAWQKQTNNETVCLFSSLCSSRKSCLYYFPQISLGPSGPNSSGLDLTGASARETGPSPLPAFMATVQQGFQELNAEQVERLRADVGTLKSNYRRTPVSSTHTHAHTLATLPDEVLQQDFRTGLLGENHPWLSEQGRMGAEWNNKADPHSESRLCNAWSGAGSRACSEEHWAIDHSLKTLHNEIKHQATFNPLKEHFNMRYKTRYRQHDAHRLTSSLHVKFARWRSPVHMLASHHQRAV